MPQSGGNGAATAGANRGGGGGGGSGCKVASLGGKSASLPSHVVDGAPVLDPLGWCLPITSFLILEILIFYVFLRVPISAGGFFSPI
jgi:hypothetical protein